MKPSQAERRVIRAAMASYRQWKSRYPSLWTSVVGLDAPTDITGLSEKTHDLIKACDALRAARKKR